MDSCWESTLLDLPLLGSDRERDRDHVCKSTVIIGLSLQTEGGTLPVGTPLALRIDVHLPMRNGQSVRAHLIYPVLQLRAATFVEQSPNSLANLPKTTKFIQNFVKACA